MFLSGTSDLQTCAGRSAQDMPWITRQQLGSVHQAGLALLGFIKKMFQEGQCQGMSHIRLKMR